MSAKSGNQVHTDIAANQGTHIREADLLPRATECKAHPASDDMFRTVVEDLHATRGQQ